MKIKKKHISIFKTIIEKGFYKPAFSDQEPATLTLQKNGLIEWKLDYTGLVLTEEGKKYVNLCVK